MELWVSDFAGAALWLSEQGSILICNVLRFSISLPGAFVLVLLLRPRESRKMLNMRSRAMTSEASFHDQNPG